MARHPQASSPAYLLGAVSYHWLIRCLPWLYKDWLSWIMRSDWAFRPWVRQNYQSKPHLSTVYQTSGTVVEASNRWTKVRDGPFFRGSGKSSCSPIPYRSRWDGGESWHVRGGCSRRSHLQRDIIILSCTGDRKTQNDKVTCPRFPLPTGYNCCWGWKGRSDE